MDVVLLIFALLAMVAAMVAVTMRLDPLALVLRGLLTAAFAYLGVSAEGWQQWSWFGLALVNVIMIADAWRKRRAGRAATAVSQGADGPIG